MTLVSKVLTLSTTATAQAFDTQGDFRAIFIQVFPGSEPVTIGDSSVISGSGIVMTDGDPIFKIEETRDGSVEPIALSNIYFVGAFIGPAFCKLNILYLR